jgi:hypothetical protein
MAAAMGSDWFLSKSLNGMPEKQKNYQAGRDS